MCEEKASAKEIAAELNRSLSAIEKRKSQLGLRVGGTNTPDVLKRAKVLQYIGEGFTIKQMAQQMRVAHPTILSMVNRLCKLGFVHRESVRTHPMRFRLSKMWTSKDDS